MAPRPPGERIGTPAAWPYLLAVSRRTPIAFSIWRSVQPRRASARSRCFLSLLETLAIPGANQKFDAVVDAGTAQVRRHAMSCIAWEEDELLSVPKEVGLSMVDTFHGMTGTAAPSGEPLYVVVAGR